MPEHRDGTPQALRDLESFLWWDFDTLDIWRDWALKRNWSEDVARRSFDDAVDVQDVLRKLAAMNNGRPIFPGIEDRLNRAIRDHGLRPRLSLADGLSLERAAVEDPAGHVLALAVSAMADGSWKRFKICRDADCRASYFDATRNGAKTWCSMETCGSRNKMRRFRSNLVRPPALQK